ncbi:PREDICTED: lysine-specific histone demethylase 1 homolog 3 isoform X2 [Camelina sativa]|uniref:Lysine-specific histone demethylase 1 homolog 3 isoform X1 n=1 Tax=Camelina sativa TaxID=90675 RepID=A0ABM0V2G5_CAMSA|nr:PREDICTED: lysine-specific histone demethylase 1 homolog 3 isoform X1 [Camelina sativa]XP_010449810.1 PREDICTED: lysine-specific histone demethylase 1 homolog 3 isoform X1 [Camelina sativa]XP_010449811.1 PREDICTED: lysine-specific histone demethylase 1 homolog 3 isoform X1 [Camelina sativa]XP_010449812.1 PREDICTED: lysine-specific histone demethylase 1 homolog 3 isoform X1 [Camelina sativa]XP_010449813.1 PREDICTED: lysine-specific histone demethylase 1 homolog 3 isoform X1 [Camelina sativa]
MDGKGRKSASKRGSKIFQFEDDADDDEPIGSLLEVMKHKTSKKNKVETESTGKRRHKQAVEKKLSALDKVSEDMNDTLASFRKRLKGTKKGVGSGTRVPPIDTVTNADLNLIEEGNTNEVQSLLLGEGLNNISVKKMVDSTVECQTHRTLLDSGTSNKRVDCISENGASSSIQKCASETGTLLHKIYGKDEAASPDHEKVDIPMTVSSNKEANVVHHITDEESERPLSEKAVELSRVSVPMTDVHGEVYSPTDRKEVAVIAPDQHRHLREPASESGYSREKNLVMCDCGIQVNVEDHSFESNTQVTLCHKCKYSSHHNAPNGSGIQLNTLEDGTAEASPISVTPCEDENFGGDAVSLPNSGKQSTLQRPERIARKRKLGNMVYEGVMNWENEQGFLDSQSDRSFKGSDKCDFVPSIPKETEIGIAAAVTAGLKAQSVSPIEKIILKEVLKRKGSHQEYLVCRNYILGLWSKNVTRILPVTECGVTGGPPESELPSASLIREVYKFLDQRGYINAGISSVKGKEGSSTNHDYDLLQGKKREENYMASVADSEEGVAFILGQVKAVESTSEDKKCALQNDERDLVGCATSEMLGSTSKTCEEDIVDDCKHSVSINALQDGTASKVEKHPETLSVAKPALSSTLSSANSNQTRGRDWVQCEVRDEKKIIVIGAGPAGLTAARHLQRQGFSVTVLEARSRVGGRVYTDRSSLSVPVDLGASIITGIEADVPSERMPDPSVLVCNQLGLELSVLHGFCPLYDTVTGEKVPAELDDALQAEFNSLIDDVDLLVEEIGKERADKLSLEDGLEFGLQRLRMPHDKVNIEKIGLVNSTDSSCSKTDACLKDDILNPLERRVMNWHFAHTEYGCAAVLKEVSLPHWNQDEFYGGFGGPHAMIKGGYSRVVESLAEGLDIHLNKIVSEVSYASDVSAVHNSKHKVRVSTSNGCEYFGDAVLVTVPLGCLKAETIKFSPSLPDWKYSSIKQLGFGVLNKVVLEFPKVFWDDSVDYFGATAEETDLRGECFMFWNVKKTVGAPVLIALVVGKAAFEYTNKSKSEHVNHAMMVLRKLFGGDLVPDPVASVVTDWGTDPYSYGAYSYVAIGASGEDYDVLGRPVQNCLFFAGEATCKEHPDTVGGAMMTGVREAVRIIDILSSGNDYTAEIETLEKAQRKSVPVRDEVKDLIKRLEVVELSNVLARQSLLRNMFFSAKTTVGRLHLAKELLNLPGEALKSFAGTKEGLAVLNSWILDSMGKNGTQLLRHCVHILVRVTSDLFAVRLSGIGKTVKEKVCAHTSRDIRAIASQLVNVWLELYRKEKANSGKKSSRQANTTNTSRIRRKLNSVDTDSKGKLSNGNDGKTDGELEDNQLPMSEEEKAVFAEAEAARAAAEAAAKAFSEAYHNTSLQLPKIPSFHKFARREQYAKMDESDFRKKFPGNVLGRQDCMSEIDSRNCKVRDWYDFPASCLDLDNSRIPVDNYSQRSHSNELVSHSKFRECSGESGAADTSFLTGAWVDTGGSSDGFKDSQAIDRWQSQAAAADPEFFNRTLHIKDDEDSIACSTGPPSWKNDQQANECSVSQVTVNKESHKTHIRSADRLKQGVVDFVASLLMAPYKAKKIDRDVYKSIMKKTATKVMQHTTDVEKAMAVQQFLDSKRKNKIRDFVDKQVDKYMAIAQVPKP